MTTIQHLPPELIFKIITYLDIKSIVAFRGTCKSVHAKANNSVLSYQVNKMYYGIPRYTVEGHHLDYLSAAKFLASVQYLGPSIWIYPSFGFFAILLTCLRQNAAVTIINGRKRRINSNRIELFKLYCSRRSLNHRWVNLSEDIHGVLSEAKAVLLPEQMPVSSVFHQSSGVGTKRPFDSLTTALPHYCDHYNHVNGCSCNTQCQHVLIKVPETLYNLHSVKDSPYRIEGFYVGLEGDIFLITRCHPKDKERPFVFKCVSLQSFSYRNSRTDFSQFNDFFKLSEIRFIFGFDDPHDAPIVSGGIGTYPGIMRKKYERGTIDNDNVHSGRRSRCRIVEGRISDDINHGSRVIHFRKNFMGYDISEEENPLVLHVIENSTNHMCTFVKLNTQDLFEGFGQGYSLCP